VTIDAIPRIVHHIWVGPAMPERLVPYVESWERLHPTWEHRMWTEFDWLENQEIFDRAEVITPHVGQLRSDLARYEILYRHGGVYVDCDLEALRPIDELCGVDGFAGWEVDGVWVNNAIVGVVPGHPLMRALIDEAPASIRRHRRERPNKMTGPGLVTPLAKRYGITLHPSATFYPYSHGELDRIGGDYGDAFTAHHWDNMRKRKGLVDA
jgi:mannosyltransferase OCH1-like enzyme